MFFNMWDWQINNNYETSQLKRAIQMELKLNMDEVKIKDVVRKRKAFEKSKLFIRRTITLLINVIVLLIGWGLIIAINYYDDTI